MSGLPAGHRRAAHGPALANCGGSPSPALLLLVAPELAEDRPRADLVAFLGARQSPAEDACYLATAELAWGSQSQRPTAALAGAKGEGRGHQPAHLAQEVGA
jgi:hypothetical protein